MNTVITVEEKMLSEAEFGLFFSYAKISKKKAQELRNAGFSVIDSKESNGYPLIHRISWQTAAVNGNIQCLNENDDKYSFPQKLWIIASKNL